MVFEFLQNINSTDTLLILVIFLIFVISVKKLIGIIMNMVWIFVAAILFPLVANRLLGIPIPTDSNTILTFAVIGVGAYLAYLVFKSVYGIAKIAAKIGGRLIPKRKKEQKKEFRYIERPKETKYEPVHHYVAKARKTKGEKELFKDYVEIEDADAGEKKAKEIAKIKEIKFEERKKPEETKEKEDED